MSRTAHAHPWMALGLILLVFVAFGRPSAPDDTEQLTRVVLEQQMQIKELENAVNARQVVDEVIAGRIDAIDCDLYGLICHGRDRWPVKVTPRSSRSTTRHPLVSAGRAAAPQLDWAALAQCESSGNPRAVSPTGRYRGLYQFDLTTWRAVGGTGDPIDDTPAEQTRRARLLYAERGRAPWPVCGARL